MYVHLDYFQLFSISLLFLADEDSIPIMDDSIMKAENHWKWAFILQSRAIIGFKKQTYSANYLVIVYEGKVWNFLIT